MDVMDDDLPFRQLARHVPRWPLLVVATIGLAAGAFALWETVNDRSVSPIVVLFFAPFVAIAMASELVSLFRALRAPTRRRFEWSGRWVGFFVFTGSALFLGAAGVVDNDPKTSTALGFVSLVLGAGLVVGLLRYLAKPVNDLDAV